MSDPRVAYNVRRYAKRASSYEDRHREIFNPTEQKRLKDALTEAAAAVSSGGRQALDFGAGSGNLTRHMINLGFEVTAADVSPDFLRIIEERFDARTVELADGSLSCVPDASFDLVGAYSVMHHIPDYLAAAASLVTKLKPGGVLLIDHERNRNHWFPPSELAAFRRENANARTGSPWDPEHKRWQHLLRAAVVPSRHLARLRKHRRISDEGDIHVYVDDHIEWERLIATLQDAGTELVRRMDYLLFSADFNETVWERYRYHCNDATGVMVRKR